MPSTAASPTDVVRAHQLKDLLDRRSPQIGTATALAPGLDACVIDGATIVMSPPTRRTAVAFARACLDNNIRHVVDLRSAREKTKCEAGPLDGSGKRVSEGPWTASFERVGRKVGLRFLGARMPAKESHASGVEVRLMRAGMAPGPYGKGMPKLGHAMQLIRMPTDGRDRAISADQLFDVCMHLAMTPQKGATVFQCADGRHASATFAAAHGFMQRVLRRETYAPKFQETLLEECLRVRGRQRPDTFRMEDLMSLTTFVGKVAEADKSGLLEPCKEPAPTMRTRMPSVSSVSSMSSTYSTDSAANDTQE
ncbi:hypothetical protein CDL60_12195 [Roseateles noduli]|nr:hypothetical protein CDL60_12195 [Roseateles noduli]